MEFDQLRTFLAVVEHGNFGRAAHALHFAQSTASFHIKALETHLGARLLDRGTGQVRLTASGQTLKAYASRILSLRAEAEARIAGVQKGAAGELTLAASTVAGEHILPPVLAAFCRENPAVAVQVLVSDSRRATALVTAGNADFAVVGAEPTDRRLASRAVAHDEIVLVAARNGPYGGCDRLSVDALATIPLLLREEGSGTRDAVAALVARAAPPNGSEGAARLRVGSTEAARNCIRAGLGVGFLSRRAVADDLESGRLVVIPLEGLPIRRTFYAVWCTGTTLSTAAERLLALLSEQEPR